jgi:hypothetical protein
MPDLNQTAHCFGEYIGIDKQKSTICVNARLQNGTGTASAGGGSRAKASPGSSGNGYDGEIAPSFESPP